MFFIFPSGVIEPHDMSSHFTRRRPMNLKKPRKTLFMPNFVQTKHNNTSPGMFPRQTPPLSLFRANIYSFILLYHHKLTASANSLLSIKVVKQFSRKKKFMGGPRFKCAIVRVFYYSWGQDFCFITNREKNLNIPSRSNKAQK